MLGQVQKWQILAALLRHCCGKATAEGKKGTSIRRGGAISLFACSNNYEFVSHCSRCHLSVRDGLQPVCEQRAINCSKKRAGISLSACSRTF
eukprot:6453505-Pyramimonas_sp.AAC.2